MSDYYFLEFSKDERHILLCKNNWLSEDDYLNSIANYNRIYAIRDRYYLQVDSNCVDNILTPLGVKRMLEYRNVDCKNSNNCKISISGLYKLFCKINDK